MSEPAGPVGPVGQPVPRGLNAFAKFLTAMSRDVPRQLVRSANARKAIRRRRR